MIALLDWSCNRLFLLLLTSFVANTSDLMEVLAKFDVSAQRAFETRIAITTYDQVLLDGATTPSRVLSDRVLDLSVSWPEVHLATRSTNGHGTSVDRHWDGSCWIEHSEGLLAVGMEFDASDSQVDVLGLFNHVDIPMMVGGESLSSMLRGWEVEKFTRKGSIAEISLFPVEQEGVIDVHIRCDLEPTFRLLEVTYNIRSKDTKQLLTSFRYAVDEWAEYDGTLMPSVAHRDGVMYTRRTGVNAGNAMWGRTLLRRTSYRSGASLPDAPMAKYGDMVFDDRLRIQYRIGDTQCLVDGHPIELDEPIEDILSIADIDLAADGSTGVSKQPWHVVVVGIVAFVTCLAVLILRRSRLAPV